MTREEFNERVNKEVPEKEYKVIEFVYQFHPLISETEGKDQVAWLYNNLGIGIFEEMEEKAAEAKGFEDEIRKTRIKLKKLEEEYAILKR